MPAATVLIVEDDITLAQAVARNLAARHYRARIVTTVAAALDALREDNPALVLLDIDLPDGSGWEVVRGLRASSGLHVPVVVISALRPNPRLVAELGCVGVLEKPFPIDSLLRLVYRAIGRAEDAPAAEEAPERIPHVAP